MVSLANGLAGWSETWKKHDWKIGDKEIWERGMWIELFEWAKNVKISVSHMNVHQKMTSVEGNFNNQMDRTMLPVNTSQPLSTATPLIA